MADGNIDVKTFEAIEREVKNLSDNTKKLDDHTRGELTQMRALIDEHGNKADAVAKERIDKFAASVETKTEALETGLADIRADIDKVATALNRNGTGGGFKGDEGFDEAKAAYEYHKAHLARRDGLKIGAKIEPDASAIRAWNENFDLYMRRGAETGSHLMAGNFQAALQTGSDPDGGYLIPTQVSQRVVQRVYESSPMRQFAHVEQIGGKELEVPRDEGEAGAGWVGETDDRPETATPQLGLSKIPAHEMYAAPRATQNMLEDAGINMEEWLARKKGDKFGRVEATATFTGNGVGKPRGILTYAAGSGNGQIQQLNSGAAADFTFDGLMDTVFSLKDGYTQNAAWMMNRLGVRNVAKLKDGQGRYIWEMGNVKDGQGRSTLLGFAVARAADMPPPGAGALMAAFGDFNQGYTIVDRLGITTLRDPFTAKPYVILYSRRRVGGDVVNFEAIKLVVGSASANP